MKINIRRSHPPTKTAIEWSLIVFWPLGVYYVALYRPSWFKKIWFVILLFIYAYLVSQVCIGAALRPGEQASAEKNWKQTVALEEKRNYFIQIGEVHDSSLKSSEAAVEYICNLKQGAKGVSSDRYIDQSASFSCADQTLEGEYSSYSTTLLKSSGFGNGLKTNGKAFGLRLATSSYVKSDWEKQSLDFDTLRSRGINEVVQLSVNNKTLDSASMAKMSVKVHYTFTDADIQILENQNASYKQYVKAEADKKAQQEADDKAKDEAVQKAASLQSITPSAPTASPSSSSASVPATPVYPAQPPAQTDNLPFKAICKDNTISYQDTPSGLDYRGMCSGHGGIQTKLGRVP